MQTEELLLEAKQFFEANKAMIGRASKEGLRSVAVDFNKLVEFNPVIADSLLQSPNDVLRVLDIASNETGLVKDVKVRFTNLPKTQYIEIRNIRSKHLGNFVFIEGLVRQSSDVRPQVTSARFECPSCGNTINVLQLDSQFREPFRCSCGRKGKFKLLSKELVDAQRLVIEESPDALEGSEQPKRINVFLKEDLVEPKMERRTTPGSRIGVVGIIYEVPLHTKTGAMATNFELAVEANNIVPLEELYEDITVSEEDERLIKEFAHDEKVYEKLRDMIAPTIYGYEEIKEAISLQLFGGIRKKKSDNTMSRGDIHILLVGDPGCLVADERVFLGDGSIIKMNEFGERHLQIISKQVLTGEGGAKRDKAIVFHKYEKQPVIEIITESGKSTKGTYNHPLLCVENRNGKLVRSWRRLDEFKIGDRIATVTGVRCTIKDYIPTNFKPLSRTLGPRFRGKLPEKVTPELASFLGYVLGDGWADKYEVGFVVAEPEKDILDPLALICEKLFGIKPKIIQRKLPDRKVPLHYATINSIDIAHNLNFIREKRVPALILRSGNKVAASFLSRLFEADGTVFDKGRGRRVVGLKAKNVELLRDVQVLLLRFGIHSRIVESALLIRRGRDIKKFADKIGFISAKKKGKLKQLVLNADNFERFGQQRSEKIAKIIRHGPEDVFDIEVPRSHRFIANGVISHNTGKSQILQFVSKNAPKGRYVAGKAATSAGLTATVVKDEILKGWSLEAGALVLANMGILCIDELEKMDPQDRTAAHEALEQQQVTISKATIQATLKAQTTVLAAANPKLGRFDISRPLPDQIDIPPTLLNRFDLIFPLVDVPQKGLDEAIATHVLAEHSQKGKKQIETDFLRKYIAHAKKITPQLTDGAIKEIKQYYVDLRSSAASVAESGGSRAIPISARQLDALIRIAEASARARLGNKVLKEDAKRAIRLMHYWLKKVGVDSETQQIDIDRILTGVPATTRSKIATIRDAIIKLEDRLGKKSIHIDEIRKEVADKGLDKEMVDEIIEKMRREGEIFEPTKDTVHRI